MPVSDNTARNSLDPSGWVDRHGDSLFRYALSRLRNPELAEEVVQETFLAALRARDQFSGRGSEGAWLLGILKRKIIDLVRRRSRPDAAVGQEDGFDPTDACFDAKGNWRFDPRLARGAPDAALLREEFWAVLRRCLTDYHSVRPTCSRCGNSRTWRVMRYVRNWGFPRRTCGSCSIGHA